MTELNIQGTLIHYETHGNAANPALVFLHGLGSSGRDWEYQIDAFAKDYYVLTIDMRGHGQSAKPKSAYTVPLFASDVIAVLNHLHIAKAHFVGLSMGGMIAFQLATDYPDHMLSMTIANSGPALVPKTFKDKVTIWMRFVIVRLMGMQKMGETLAPRLFVDADQENHRQTFIERWSAIDPNAYLNALRAIVGWTVEDKISKITIPTLVLAADQDYTPISAKEAYLAKMPNATLKVIENAHHAVAIERPEAFNQAVMEFLASVG